MEKRSIKDKIKALFQDEKKRAIIILVLVVIILAAIITIALLVHKKMQADNTPTTTRITTTKKVDVFKGYNTTEITPNNNITYNLEKNYEFIYAKGEDRKTIYTNKADLELLYELTLVDGTILFTEQRHNDELNAYEYTGKTYTYKVDNKITDFIVATTCEQDVYSIAAIDEKKNIWLFNSLEEEFNINDILEGFSKVKTISPAKKIGYYNDSNNPNNMCVSYELIYLDNSNHVRYLTGKNQLFFDSAYYRYIGSKDYDNFVYVLKNGLMKYDIGNNSSYLYDGNYHIKYRGSFYTINNNQEDLYIIGTDGYLYVIKNLTESSEVLLTRVSDELIKRIGTRVITTDNDFATDKSKLIVEFVDEKTLEIAEIYAYELLN